MRTNQNTTSSHVTTVLISDWCSPQMADIYTQHSCQVNVAKYSPSGFYIASADKSGKVTEN